MNSAAMSNGASSPSTRTTRTRAMSGLNTWMKERWVGGHLCGQSQTMEVGGQVVYSIHVLADGPGGAAECGTPDETVKFRYTGRGRVVARTVGCHAC